MASPEWTAAAAAVERLLTDRGLVVLPAEASDEADGFLALPGAVESLEGLFDRWLGTPDGFGALPCGLLNTGEYYTALLRNAGDATMERFVRETQRGALIVDRDPEVLLRALADFRPPETRRNFA